MSQPGDATWKWFPDIKDDWGLDVVTLLAVIGESAMLEHSQAITASLFGMLPRLLPAPQALLKPNRPMRMPVTAAKMAGVYSGYVLESVGYFANIIHPLEEMPALGFKVINIRHSASSATTGKAQPLATLDSPLVRTVRWCLLACLPSARRERKMATKAGQSNGARARRDEEAGEANGGDATGITARDFAASGSDVHQLQPIQRRGTAKVAQDLVQQPTMALNGVGPAVPAKLLSPIHILSVLSCMVSIAIIGCAIKWQDGNAILAVSMLSLSSSVVGVSSWWQPILSQRRSTNRVPNGDIMIRTREGAFLLVRCTEEVARELYSGTEECRYYIKGRSTYRLLMALGTTMLMTSVVLLGNCQWNSQIFIGGSYIVLNGLYWGLGMIPTSYFWDLSRYEWEDATPEDCLNAEEITDHGDQREGHPSFTRTLWYAIRETKRIGWVQISGAAYGTDSWNEWLKEAGEEALKGNRKWGAVARKNKIMDDSVAGQEDQAGNHAPASPVADYPNPTPSSSF